MTRRPGAARKAAVRTRSRARIARKGDPSSLLYDRVTALPTLPLFFGRIRRALKRRSVLGLMTVSIIQNDRIEQIFGWEAFDVLIRDLARFLVDIKPAVLREEDVISEVMISGNAFVILLAPPRDRYAIRYADMDKIRGRIQGRLQEFLSTRLASPLSDHLEFYIGCATLENNSSQRFERLVYQSLDEAFSDSLRQQKREARREAGWLRELLRGKKVYPVFQPVVDLEARGIMGYEVLSRTGVGEFQNPDHFFRVAYENDQVWALDRVCRERALAGVGGALDAHQLLFLNIEPESIYDPELGGETTARLLAEAGLTPGRVVLELTEHAAVKDFSLFRQTLRTLQSAGFRLAIDDVGSAYSGLRSIAELKPDFMKIDMSLTRDIHVNDIKRELLGTIFKFSRNTGIGLIAEGIEEPQDLLTLREIGIRFAQGYLLARPDRALPPVDFEAILG